MTESINVFRVAEGKKMKGPFRPLFPPGLNPVDFHYMQLIENKRRKFKACKNKNGCKVCDDCEGNLQCEKCVMCKKCCAAIKRKKDSLIRTELKFEEWFALFESGKTTEPFWKFIEPKRKVTVPRKSKEEKIWDEIVKADGRPFKEREDYNSDKEFKKERKLAGDELDSNADLYEEESCFWCDPSIPNGMRKVRLELFEWRQRYLKRRIAKMKNEEETRKREKLELIRWQQEIRKEEAKSEESEGFEEFEEFEESPCESEDEEPESLFKIKFESESDSD